MRKLNVRKGKTPFGSKQTIELSVIKFVFEHLAKWRDDPTRQQKNTEPHLNPQLSKYLDKASRDGGHPFFFQIEEPQNGQRRVDFVSTPDDPLIASGYFNSIYDEIMVFEAKLLPALKVAREREYVTSGQQVKMSGGIQRFKAGAHGHRHKIAAIIAYIQKNEPQYFYDTINAWISELAINSTDGLVWDIKEQLCGLKINANGTARSKSKHTRGNLDNIVLHHLWVKMHDT